MKPPPAPPSDTEIAARLRRDIAEGAPLKDGRLPPERELAQRHGISRARLRRVLDLLAADGTIFRRRGQGTFVLPPPATDAARLKPLARRVTPAEVIEVRLSLEPRLAALAATRATPQERAQFAQIAAATQSAEDQRSYDAADDIFHYKIAEMAHNALFLTMYEAIRSVRQEASWIRPRAETYSGAVFEMLAQQHQALATAIIEGDAPRAAEAMQTHLQSVSDTLSRADPAP